MSDYNYDEMLAKSKENDEQVADQAELEDTEDASVMNLGAVDDSLLESALLTANSGSMTDDAKSQAISKALNGGSMVLMPSSQLVMNKVAEMIMKGDMNLDITSITNARKRAKVIGRVITELEMTRLDMIKEYKKDLFREAKTKGVDTDTEEFRATLRRADGCIKVFSSIPGTVIVALLVASKAVQSITYVRGASEKNRMLLYRDYDHGVAKLWSEIDTGKSGDLSEISHMISLLNADLSGVELKKMRTLLLKWTKPTFVEGHDTKIIFVKNGVIDCRDIHWNEQLQMNVDDNGVIAKLYPYGTEEAEELICREYPLKYGCPYDFHAVTNLPLPVYREYDGIPWDPISGIRELFNDDEQYKADYDFENLQATVRGTNYGRATLHVNKAGGAGGGNGKTTFLEIKIQLIGRQYVLAVSIPTIGNDKFALETLTECAAIFCSEGQSASGEKYEVDLFKDLCRQDTSFYINRKHKPGVTFNWHGGTDWAMNEGRINPKDGSDSVYAAVNIVEYNKSFRGSHERAYIKNDYIKRTDTLEYLLWYVLVKVPFRENDQYSPELIEKLEPAKKAFRSASRPVMSFLDEVMLESFDEENNEVIPAGIHLQRTPSDVLFAIYLAWARRKGYTQTMNLRNFRDECAKWCGEHRGEFVWMDKKYRLKKDDTEGLRDDPAIVQNVSMLNEYISDARYTEHKATGAYVWNDKSKNYLFTGVIFTKNAYNEYLNK